MEAEPSGSKAPTEQPGTSQVAHRETANSPSTSARATTQHDAEPTQQQQHQHAAACTSPGAPGCSALSMDTALSRFKSGALNFHVIIEGLMHATEKERESLEEARKQLEEDRRQFDEECRRVQHVLNDAEQVTLSVGGCKFTTSVSTLRNAPSPSLFNAMFSGRHKLTPDSDGCYFIDRDGRHFHDILNYLRDRTFSCPSEGVDYKYLLELRAEANYYGLTGLMIAIDRFPYGQLKVSRASSLNLDDSWMYEDGQDEIVFTVDKPIQLLGVGLCGTEGGLTAELEVYEVDGEDFSHELGTLSSCAHSFTKADGQVLRMQLPDPVALLPGKYYMLSALIKGAESYCCEDCLETVIVGGATIHFHSWESPNGTNENRGQFPELYIRML